MTGKKMIQTTYKYKEVVKDFNFISIMLLESLRVYVYIVKLLTSLSFSTEVVSTTDPMFFSTLFVSDNESI